ncbi:hypothetical protein RAA17_23240 [Komagataeibacter rhaeticus]|nr:hypothetical protein [Komagataeibacter rhaeticus]
MRREPWHVTGEKSDVGLHQEGIGGAGRRGHAGGQCRGAQARGQSSGSSAAGSYVPGQAEGERASAGVSQYSAPETGAAAMCRSLAAGKTGKPTR